MLSIRAVEEAVRRPKMLPTVMVLLALLGAACSAKQQTPPEWVKTRSSAEDFEPAYATCKSALLATMDSAADKTAASVVGVREFLRCMSDKGWERAPGPKPASRK